MLSPGGCRHEGFTLIELLLVIAVLVVLLAILLPSLGHTRETARKSVCMTRQRGAGQILQRVAYDQRDRLPPCSTPGFITALSRAVRDKIEPYADGQHRFFYCTNSPYQPQDWFAAGAYVYIGYYYMGNPLNDMYWLDVNGNGQRRDEYVVSMNDPHAPGVALMACQSGQNSTHNWRARHPLDYGSKSVLNVLYGDGHVESRRRSQLVARWYLPSPVAW